MTIKMKIPLAKSQINNLNKMYLTDYDKQPIGGDNPYYQCSSCFVSEPQINGNVLNHTENCTYRRDKLTDLIALRAI